VEASSRRAARLGGALAGLAALLWVGAWALDLRATQVVLRPFPLLILAAALPEAPPAPWPRALRPALLLCAVGDLLLALPGRALLPALLPYGLAHLVLLAGLLAEARAPALRRLLPPLLIALPLYAALRGSMGEEALPLGLYTLLATATAWRALAAWERPAGPLRAIGAGALLLSDALLGLDRTAAPLPGAPLLVALSRWGAVAAYFAAAFAGPSAPVPSAPVPSAPPDDTA
jgi:uncharacterized membrane protein YhhN